MDKGYAKSQFKFNESEVIPYRIAKTLAHNVDISLNIIDNQQILHSSNMKQKN